MLVQIPKPVTETITLKGHHWTFSVYEEYLAHFKKNGGIAPEIVAELEGHLGEGPCRSFRVQMVLKGVPFLAGFLIERREIVIASPRLARELFLLESGASPSMHDLETHITKILAIDIHASPTVIEQITARHRLPDFFNDPELKLLCQKARHLEEGLLRRVRRHRRSLFERLSDFFLQLTTQYALFRIHLLKFIAILPCLDHDKRGKEVKRVYLETLRRLLADSKSAPFPKFLALVFRLEYLLAKRTPAWALAKNIRFWVRRMARRFIAGESIEKAAKIYKGLRKTKRDLTLDQLGELVVSEKEADHYCEQVLELIGGLGQHIPKGEKNAAGLLRANVSVKVSALASDFKPAAPEYTYKKVAPRLKKILLAALENEVFINIDAEHYASRDLVFYIYRRALLETPELKKFAAVGIALQTYLRDAYEHFEEILALAKERGLAMPVRLVKGAYWDQETIEAQAGGFDAPEFLNKEETDLHFRQLIIKILEAAPHLQLVLGSHNLADHCFAEMVRSEKFSDAPPIEHQCLHMTYEALSKGMAKMGWAVRNYVPIGSLLVGMAYLVRRIMENSSQVGILVQMRTDRLKTHSEFPHVIHQRKKEALEICRDPSVTELNGDFFNAIPLRFHVRKEKEALDKAFSEFTETKLGQDYSHSNYSGKIHKIFSPSRPETFVGQIQYANPENAKEAIERARQAYNRGEWAKAAPIERAATFLKAADWMLLARLELTALMVHEGGKNFFEAINDVNEAIDFLNFYAREECKLAAENKNRVSRGVFGVISPWNFPLAIPTGMAAGALIAGNCVLLKPADHTPLITQRLADILHAAGVPEDVFIHLPGQGSEVGKLLVEDPRVAGVVFTGSKEVGMWIAHTKAKQIVRNELFGFEAPARAITEMGGKNAIIVSPNAELDETVAGILYSAFGNAGQKCSACSRVIVHEAVKDRLMARLKEACRDIRVGPAFDHATSVNPLIARREKERLQREAAEVIRETRLYGGHVHVDRSGEDLPGWCMGPVVVELPLKRALQENSYAKKELFGPILHVAAFGTLEEAVKLFNATEYGLTGGIFSQSQDDVEYFSKYLEAGNIYVNRSITGARVSIEPFGGFKLSGTGPKVGGPFYLEAFHIPLESKETRDQKIVEIDAASVQKYRQLIGKAADFFREKFHWNRKIPGQISFNDLSLIKKRGLYLALEEQPNIKTFLYLLAAWGLGCEVAVFCKNEAIHDYWRAMAKNLEPIRIELSDAAQIAKALQDKEVSFVMVEGGTGEISHFLGQIYDGTYEERSMRQVLTKLDAPPIGDFERYLEPFIQVRSFAVNVMRHGAPLELKT